MLQLQDLASMLSFDGEYINWKSFIVAVAQPIALPTNDELMETLAKFKEMDQRSMGYVTREQYDKVKSGTCGQLSISFTSTTLCTQLNGCNTTIVALMIE